MFRRNFFIFHSGALGDFIVTWPIAMAASRLYAQSRVIYVTNSEKGALAERLLRVDSTDVETGWHELFSESPDFNEKTRRLLDGAHSRSASSPRRAIDGAGIFRTIAPEAHLIHVQTKEPESSSPRHVTEYLLEQLRPAPALYSATAQMLKWVQDNGVGSHIAKKDAPVVIHPGSGARASAGRRSGLSSWRRCCDRTARGCDSSSAKWSASSGRLIGSTASARSPIWRNQNRTRNYTTSSRQAAQFVGNDTGPTHLAAICGVPTVAIFGDDPTRWRPIGPRVSVIQGDSIDAIPTADVLNAVQ